jgi:predicted DNA-binding transcriptional regulator YafY
VVLRTSTRFPLERIAAFDRAVRAGEYPNAGTVAKRLEVSRRTLQRDIEFLRDRLGAPLIFDPRRQGYAYSDPSFRLPEVPMTEGELLALALAERVLRQYRGTPYAPDLARAFGKVAAKPLVAHQGHRGPSHREALYRYMLQAIAVQRVADRPNRFEPRMTKGKPKNYDRLRRPRQEIKRVINTF